MEGIAMTGVEGFVLDKLKGRGRDMYVLSRAGQRVGLFPTEISAWQRARRIRDKESASVMVPSSRGTSDRLVRP